MPQDTSTFDEVLKTVYEGGIRDLVASQLKTLELFETRDAREWGGRFVEYPIRVGRNQGVGSYSEMGALPAAGRQQYTQVRIPMKYTGGRISFSTHIMKASAGPRSAFVNAMDSEQDGLIKDLRA